jgi:hypothetical protein
MRVRISAISIALLGLALVLASASAAAVIGVYRNSMESDSQRGQLVKLSGSNCGRGGSDHAFRIFVGKATSQCAYRTPVVGRDLELAVTARLLEGTPKPLQRKAFLAVNLRTGGAGAGYQLAVFPLQRKAQLRKVTGDGRIEYLHVEHGVPAMGLNRPNLLRLRAFNVTGGPQRGSCRVLAYVGKQLVADVSDSAAGELAGRSSGFSLGATGNAKGTLGSFDDIVIRVPSPF